MTETTFNIRDKEHVLDMVIETLDKPNALNAAPGPGGLKLYKANELTEAGVTMVVAGAAGFGKTTLCAEGAQDSPYGRDVLLLDVEGGARAISHRADITVRPVMDFGEFNLIRDWAIRPGPTGFPFKTIVVDNLSEITKTSLKKITAGKDAPQIQDYGRNAQTILALVRDYRELSRRTGINVFFVMWDFADTDSTTGLVRRELNTQPAVFKDLPGMVDIVGHLTMAQDGTRVLSFAPSSKSPAKFRRNGSEAAASIPLTLPFRLEDKLMADLLATLVGGKPFPAAKYTKKDVPAKQ